jgi:hypothetical protein
LGTTCDRGLGINAAEPSDAIEVVQHRTKFQEQCTIFRKAINSIKGLLISTMIGTWEGASTSDLQLCEFTNDSDDEVEFDEAYTSEISTAHTTLKHGMETVLCFERRCSRTYPSERKK